MRKTTFKPMKQRSARCYSRAI